MRIIRNLTLGPMTDLTKSQFFPRTKVTETACTPLRLKPSLRASFLWRCLLSLDAAEENKPAANPQRRR